MSTFQPLFVVDDFSSESDDDESAKVYQERKVDQSAVQRVEVKTWDDFLLLAPLSCDKVIAPLRPSVLSTQQLSFSTRRLTDALLVGRFESRNLSVEGFANPVRKDITCQCL